jgi:hypothetical protein
LLAASTTRSKIGFAGISRQTYSPTPSTGTPSRVQQFDEPVLCDASLAD